MVWRYVVLLNHAASVADCYASFTQLVNAMPLSSSARARWTPEASRIQAGAGIQHHPDLTPRHCQTLLRHS